VNMPFVASRARLAPGALLVVLTIALAGCGGGNEPASYQPKEVRAEIVVAARTTVPRTVMATGELEAQNSVEVSTRMMGHVREVLVREGEKVTAGQCLLRIDDTDMLARKRQAEAAIAEARAVLENAETNLARFERLYAEHWSPRPSSTRSAPAATARWRRSRAPRPACPRSRSSWSTCAARRRPRARARAAWSTPATWRIRASRW